MIVGTRTDTYTDSNLVNSDWRLGFPVYSKSAINGEIYVNSSFNFLMTRFSSTGTEIILNKTVVLQSSNSEILVLSIDIENAGLLNLVIEPIDLEGSKLALVSVEIRSSLPLTNIFPEVGGLAILSLTGIILAVIWDRFGSRPQDSYMIFSHVSQMDTLEIIGIVFLNVIGYKYKPLISTQFTLDSQVVTELIGFSFFPIALWSIVALLTMGYLSIRQRDVQYLWTAPKGRERVLACRLPQLLLRLVHLSLGVVLFYPYLNYVLFGAYNTTAQLMVLALKMALVLTVNSLLTAFLYFTVRNAINTWAVVTSVLIAMEYLELPFLTIGDLAGWKWYSPWILTMLVAVTTPLVTNRYMKTEVVR